MRPSLQYTYAFNSTKTLFLRQPEFFADYCAD